jgi:hypothetical protein
LIVFIISYNLSKILSIFLLSINIGSEENMAVFYSKLYSMSKLY